MTRRIKYIALVVVLLALVICSFIFHQYHHALDGNDLLITSDSSVGIRAFEGKGPAEGKLVLLNVGNSPLKEIHVKLLHGNSTVTLKNNTCSDALLPGKTCNYTVSYLPGNDTDERVEFRASAFNTPHIISHDSYTMNVEKISHHTWTTLQEMNFTPRRNFIINIKKGNADVLYAESDAYSGKVIVRSTDGLHWSIVGGDKTFQRPVAVSVDSHNHLFVLSPDTLSEYDGKNWRIVKEWHYINASASSLLLTSNGDIYVGFEQTDVYGGFVDHNRPGVLKFDGKRWELTNQDWFLGLGNVNDLQEIKGSVYAATDNGVVQFDGKAWTPVGGNLFVSGNMTHVKQLLQTPEGKLYAFYWHGVAEYDFHKKRWSDVGKWRIKNWPKQTPSGAMVYCNNTLYISVSGGAGTTCAQYHPETNRWMESRWTGEGRLFSINGGLYALIDDSIFVVHKNFGATTPPLAPYFLY